MIAQADRCFQIARCAADVGLIAAELADRDPLRANVLAGVSSVLYGLLCESPAEDPPPVERFGTWITFDPPVPTAKPAPRARVPLLPDGFTLDPHRDIPMVGEEVPLDGQDDEWSDGDALHQHELQIAWDDMIERAEVEQAFRDDRISRFMTFEDKARAARTPGLLEPGLAKRLACGSVHEKP